MLVDKKYLYTVSLQGEGYGEYEWDIWIYSSDVHLTTQQVHAAILLRHVEFLIDWGFANHDGTIKETTEIKVHETSIVEL